MEWCMVGQSGYYQQQPICQCWGERQKVDTLCWNLAPLPTWSSLAVPWLWQCYEPSREEETGKRINYENQTRTGRTCASDLSSTAWLRWSHCVAMVPLNTTHLNPWLHTFSCFQGKTINSCLAASRIAQLNGIDGKISIFLHAKDVFIWFLR